MPERTLMTSTLEPRRPRNEDAWKDALRDLSTRLMRSVPAGVAFAGTILLLALQVPFLREFFKGLGIGNNTNFQAVVITLLLTTVLLELRELARTIRRDDAGPQHFDTGQMYDTLKARADAIKKREHRRIDVLGLTLFSAWIHIGPIWLDRDGCVDWTIRFATLAKDAKSTGTMVPDDWLEESAGKAAQIRKYAQLPATKQRRHSIEVVEYDFVPGVHGFRLGNGDLFVSCVRWQEDGKLGKQFTYEFIPCNDVSFRADAYRALFENWFNRAVSGAPAPT
jgi:hypothetical protein